MGQAIDETIKMHETRYPRAKVYAVRSCVSSDIRPGNYRVELAADHFSTSLVYFVPEEVQSDVRVQVTWPDGRKTLHTREEYCTLKMTDELMRSQAHLVEV